MLKTGDKAPDFTLETVHPDDSQSRVSLSDYEGKTLVLYFYPKDSTPGCTREAQAFSAARRAIETAGGAVLGVSRDSPKSHCSFRDKCGITIALASDPELAVHKAYGAWGAKKMYGRDVVGCIRSTFLVKDGRIQRVFSNVKVDGHADQVLQAIGELESGPSSRHIGAASAAPAATAKPSAKAKAKAVAEAVAKKVAKTVARAVARTIAKTTAAKPPTKHAKGKTTKPTTPTKKKKATRKRTT